MTTEKFILNTFEKYPLSEVCDLYKALYQSVCGCEHLIADESAAAEYIAREAEGAVMHGEETETLDGGKYCRVYLDSVKNGLSPVTLARLFVMSAEKCASYDELEKRLNVLSEMAKVGKIPLKYVEIESFISSMKEKGYPPCHHSEAYRGEYFPSYRLMKSEYAAFLSVFRAIDSLLCVKETVVVAVDGRCASGKTTFAGLLAGVYDANVFHMDDYFLRPEQRTAERYAEIGGNVDRERFLDEVLLPLSRGENVVSRRYDCSTSELSDGAEYEKKRLNIVEGSYSMHPDLREHYDLSVMLDISKELQRERIIKRDGERSGDFFAKWIPLEERYFEAFDIAKKCDIVVCTLPE